MTPTTTTTNRSTPLRPLAPRHRRGRPGRATLLAAGTLLGTLAVGLVVVGTATTEAEARQSSRAGASDLAPATVRSFDITTVASGELEARNQIEIRSELESRSTINFIVDEGSRVNAGDLLVRLNDDEIETEIEEELLRVESARLDLAAAETDLRIQLSDNDEALRDAELRVELAKLALEQWQDGTVTKRRKQLQLDVEQAERQLERLSEKFERSEELLSQGFLSKNERDIDEINFIDARARVETALLDQDIYEKYDYPRDERTKISDVDKAEANLDRVREKNDINLKNRQSNVATKKRQLQMREQRLAKYESQLEACTVIAPSDGLVVYATSINRNRWGGNDGPLQIGRQISPNELLIVLPDTSEMMATVRVHEALAGRLRPGQPADVKIEAAGPEAFKGTVESIGVLAETGGWRDPNRREYSVRIALDFQNDAGVLKPSMRVEGEVMLGNVEDALSIPVQSVFTDGAMRYVYRPAGSRFERVPVQIGRRSSVFAEVLGGLGSNDRVLLRAPDAGEVSTDPIPDDRLAAAGLTRDANGAIVRAAPPAGRPTAGQRAASVRPTSATATTTAGKPATATN